jgi:hypothetical protein
MSGLSPLTQRLQRASYPSQPGIDFQMIYPLPRTLTVFTTFAGVLLPKGRFYTLSPLSKRVAQKPA